MSDEQILEVRSLIPDDYQGYGENGDEYMFSEDQLNAVFDGSGRSSVIRTVAWMCFALGGSDLIVLKTIRNDEISTNGAPSAAEWRERAELFFKLADSDDGSLDETFDLYDPLDSFPHAEASPWHWRGGMWD